MFEVSCQKIYGVVDALLMEVMMATRDLCGGAVVGDHVKHMVIRWSRKEKDGTWGALDALQDIVKRRRERPGEVERAAAAIQEEYRQLLRRTASRSGSGS